MNFKTILAALMLTPVISQAHTDVEWQVVSHDSDSDGKPTYTQRFIVKGDMSNLDRLCFNQFDRKMTPTDPNDTVRRIIPGYYYITTPRFASGADSVVVEIVTSGSATQYSFGPDGVHGVDRNRKPFEVAFARRSQTQSPTQWSVPGRDLMPYGDKVYEINEALVREAAPLNAYDIAPSFKKVTLGKGLCKKPEILSEKLIKADNPEFFRIAVTKNGVNIEGASEAALKMARRTVGRLVEANPDGLPVATVEDWPDYGYRGMMIDVARNFQTLDQMKKFVDAMADLRMNRLQFHFIDDEAWRLEIPDLPELTDYASRRGYTTDEADFLAQIYTGNGLPDGPENHGRYTRGEFIEFLRYCNDRGISVIPEIETPGHARAAVLAMENRYRRTGDDTYRLREDSDTSVYRSAQDFNDNVMNPALPGAYKFMDKVLDEVVAMYTEAGAPLVAIHIGGDEVPHGAWSGSPSAQKFMAEKSLKTESELHAYWVEQMAEALAKRGVRLSGWQEIGLGHSADFADRVTPNVEFVNLWISRAGNDGVMPGTKALELGYPVVVSAVNHFYLDLAHSFHPDERGLTWGGAFDEFTTLDGYPEQIAPSPANAKSKIVGVQGQMWAETMRGPEWMESYLFPRVIAVAERAWNSDSTYTHSEFNTLLDQRELPALSRRGINYHLRQPGIKVADGKINMNAPYSSAEIRYTIDGSSPSADSQLYTGPIDLTEDIRQIRATLYLDGKHSVESILNID